MKDEKEKAFFQNLNNLDDADVEKISVDIPALDKQAKKRIFDKCMSRMSETDFESENTVSGTDKYSKPHIIRYISTAAACLVAVAGITGMIFFNRNIGTPPDDISATPPYTAVSTELCTSAQTTKSTAKIVTIVTTVGDATATITETDNEPVETVVSDDIIMDIMEDDITETTVSDEISEPLTEISATEQPTETSETEIVSDISDDDYFSGRYTTHKDSDSGSEILIVKTDENTYHVELTFYRIAYLSDGTGSVNNDILTFTTGSIEGSPAVTAEITLNDNGCILKITESEHSYILPDSEGMQYYRIS